MVPIIISSLLACVSDDYRMSWTQHEPTWDFPSPSGDVTWKIDGGSTPFRERRFEQALDEWRISMSCIFEPKRSDTDAQATITFSCSEPPYSTADHGRITTGRRVDDGRLVVWVSPELCDSAGDVFFMHAVGHAIGLADKQMWYPSTMDQFSIMPGSWDGDFPSLERDGMRIWALNQGAPGCGSDDPRWSWESNPDYYSGEPPDLDALLGR